MCEFKPSGDKEVPWSLLLCSQNQQLLLNTAFWIYNVKYLTVLFSHLLEDASGRAGFPVINHSSH